MLEFCVLEKKLWRVGISQESNHVKITATHVIQTLLINLNLWNFLGETEIEMP